MSNECPESANIIPAVSPAESGQKLIRFLGRRYDYPDSLFYKLIRSGQIRINGGRKKPFDRVYEGDLPRIPYFLEQSSRMEQYDLCDDELKAMLAEADLKLLGRSENIIALYKPAGIAVHSGTGHEDNIAARLLKCFKNCFYKPSPCHRLDRDTAGILLCGLTYEAERQIHEAIGLNTLKKEYIGKICGEWPYAKPKLFCHYLRKEYHDGKEKMAVHEDPLKNAKKSVCLIKPVDAKKGLIQIALLTGRTHQIRAQLAALGCPLACDSKYGFRKKSSGFLMLHAFRIALKGRFEFISRPDWFEYSMPLPPVFSERETF